MQAHTMLRWIYDNYEEALKKVSWIRDWIVKNANHRLSTDIVLNWIEAIDKPYYRLSKKSRIEGREAQVDIVLETAEECLKEGKGYFKFTDFLKKLTKKSDNWRPLEMSRAMFPSRYEIYRTLLDNGYNDTFDSPEPAFYKNYQFIDRK